MNSTEHAARALEFLTYADALEEPPNGPGYVTAHACYAADRAALIGAAQVHATLSLRPDPVRVGKAAPWGMWRDALPLETTTARVHDSYEDGEPE